MNEVLGQLKRKGIRRPPQSKLCPVCCEVFIQRPTESTTVFNLRTTCSTKCHHASTVPTKIPAEVGTALQAVLNYWGIFRRDST